MQKYTCVLLIFLTNFIWLGESLETSWGNNSFAMVKYPRSQYHYGQIMYYPQTLNAVYEKVLQNDIGLELCQERYFIPSITYPDMPNCIANCEELCAASNICSYNCFEQLNRKYEPISGICACGNITDVCFIKERTEKESYLIYIANADVHYLDYKLYGVCYSRRQDTILEQGVYQVNSLYYKCLRRKKIFDNSINCTDQNVLDDLYYYF